MTCQICLQKYEMKYASERRNVALPLTLIYIGPKTIYINISNEQPQHAK